MNKAAVIQKQIASCEKLLEVFQEERQLYSNAGNVDMQTLLQRIEYKKQIIDTFENQKDLLTSINQESSRKNAVEVEKQLLKQLGTVLEKLLVIDQENEIMLKKLLSTVNQNAKAESSSVQAGRFNVSQPFCPNSSKQLRQAPLSPNQSQAQARSEAGVSTDSTERAAQQRDGRENANLNSAVARPKTNARQKLKAYSHLR